MPISSLSAVVQHLRAAAGKDGGGRTDAELLTQFLNRRDEDALTALIGRHGPMVWGVCCRVLRHPHDAEDAFQATFLVLVQKAATVVPRDMVANWLHGVAQQTAVRLRASAAKRGWREVQMDVMPEPAVAEARDEELLSWLDEELSRLPERFRALILLCDLEGRTRKEVARQLCCPEGTVASGLARARALLAKRLTRRGLAVSGGSLAAILSHSMASADVPASVVTSTINVATLLAAGKAAGVISGPVATLTQGVLKTMLLRNILSTTMAVLALGVAVITCGSLAVGQTDGQPAVGTDVKAPVAEKPVAPAAKQEKVNQEPEVAWGKEVDGLQLGLVRVPADKTTFRPGETMEFIVKVRNVSKDEVAISYGRPESTPTITDATGEKVHVVMPPIKRYIVIPSVKTLRPGETVQLFHRLVATEEALKGEAEPRGAVNTPTIRVGAGKYKIAFPEFVQRDLVLSTGQIEFEMKDSDEKKQPEQKEAFTAWGKEVGGLQAGLGFKAGEKRVYTHGEKVTLVVRVRNVGKEPVTFGGGAIVWQLTNPISVTDSDGKAVYVQCLRPFGSFGQLGHQKTQLPPGKEVEYDQVTLQLKPAVAQEKQVPDNILFGSGKFRVEYRTDGFGSNNPTTGKLELEVKEPEKVPQDKKEAFIAAPVPKEKAKTDYWPRRVGDKWVYTLDGREVSEEVARVTEKDGETRVTTTHTDGTDSLEIDYLVKGGAVYQTKSGLYTFDPPIRQVDIELKAGAKWESKTPLTEGVIGNCGEMVAGEEEEVKVPAGTFKAVQVVYTVTEVDGKPIAKQKVYTYWYAAGVGVVKLKYDGGEKVLKSFTPTDPKREAK